jgi:hypothetical protein
MTDMMRYFQFQCLYTCLRSGNSDDSSQILLCHLLSSWKTTVASKIQTAFYLNWKSKSFSATLVIHHSFLKFCYYNSFYITFKAHAQIQNENSTYEDPMLLSKGKTQFGLLGYDTLWSVWGSAVFSNCEQMAAAGFSDSGRTPDDAG